jgi:hypothetical protein
MGDAHEFLILFIPTLSMLLKKHVHLTYLRDTCHFYRLGWRSLVGRKTLSKHKHPVEKMFTTYWLRKTFREVEVKAHPNN